MSRNIDREHAKMKAHTCMVHTEGLLHGYKDDLTEKERRAVMDAKRTFERIMNRLGRNQCNCGDR